MSKELQLSEDEKMRMLKTYFPELNMSDKRECLHCGEVINVGDFRVFNVGKFLTVTCPQTECDGTPIDWMPLT